MNVLITSLSKKISLIKMVKRALEKVGGGHVFGADINPRAVGSYFVDKLFSMMPEVHLETFITFCKKEKIDVIIPTRDAELPFFSKAKKAFLKEGIHVMVSPPQSIEICRDKLLFYQTLKERFPVVPIGQDVDLLEGETFVVKERFGAGGREMGVSLTRQEANVWSIKLKEPLFQPYILGDEYSIDLYLTATSKVHGVVARRREWVENGESQITTTERQPHLESLMSELAEALKLEGHVVVQAILSDEIAILECNPRFGGASRLSCEVGLDSFYWFFLEILGQPLPSFERSKKEKTLIRYPEDLIL